MPGIELVEHRRPDGTIVYVATPLTLRERVRRAVRRLAAWRP